MKKVSLKGLVIMINWCTHAAKQIQNGKYFQVIDPFLY